ncbi:MAG: TolB family protein [Rubripirellula sp.]
MMRDRTKKWTLTILAFLFFLNGETSLLAQDNSSGATLRRGLASVEATSAPPLREVIVSHTDENDILQLYRMKEDGAESVQLTHSEHGCRMPAASPDGKKLVYAEVVNHSLSLRLSDIDGKNPRALVSKGMNLLPSWLPDSRHVIWMKAQPGQKNRIPPAIARST